MRSKSIMSTAVGIALALQGCSSRPREFTPSLAAPAADQAKFDADHAECRQLLVEGRLDSNGRLASAGAGAAAGGATLLGGAAAAGAAGMYGGMAIASATVVLIPFAAVGGAWAMAKAKRNKKERAIQTAMAGCLTERGYQIVDWKRAR